MPAALGPLLLLFCVALYAAPGDSAAMVARELCQCLQTANFVPWKNFKDFQVTAGSPLCSKEQIILTLKNNAEVCLNPESRQGQRIQKCWAKIKNKSGRKRKCWSPTKA